MTAAMGCGTPPNPNPAILCEILSSRVRAAWRSRAEDCLVRPKGYQRNKELVEACDLLYAFISAEDGFTGGTRFEVEYAVSLGIPVLVDWENGLSEWIFQYCFTFNGQEQAFLLSWEGFFHKIRFELGGSA